MPPRPWAARAAAWTANDMAPTNTGRPDLPCTSVAPLAASYEAVAGVVRLGDDGIEGAAVQGRVHFIGDLFQPAVEHGQGDGV